MKILYVITQAEIGGAQKYVLDLAKYFKGTIVSGTESQELSSRAQELGIQYLGMPELKRNISLFSNIGAIFALRKVYKKMNPDIVHLNSSMAGFLGSLASIGLKTKVIYTAHGFVFNESLPNLKKLAYIYLEKFASIFRDKIITVSDFDFNSALKYNISPKSKLITIHNGLEKKDFLTKEEALCALHLPADKFILGTIANAYPTKGIEVLLKAINLLDEPLKQRILYVLIGDGPEMQNYKTYIAKNKLASQVRLLGNVSNASKYLKAFNAFVLPSKKEGFPYAILEAMQAGLPIIASKVGGIPEAMPDSGILTELNNPLVLATAIQTLLHNPEKQKQLSEKSIEQSKMFSLENMLSSTEKVYKLFT
jgi:glycosyltransferase involved in cell wall biosynthesis